MAVHLVAGATGTLGSAIARGLLKQHKEVRVLVRPSSNYETLVERGAQPRLGDLRDRASLDIACRDVDVVITTAHSGGSDGAAEAVDGAGNRNLVDAAKRAGVTQYIVISCLAVEQDAPSASLRARRAAEDYLRASGVIYSIFAPDLLLEVCARQLLKTKQGGAGLHSFFRGDPTPHAFVSTSDVASFALHAIFNRAAVDCRLALGGPEAVTWGELQTRLDRILDERPVLMSPVSDLFAHQPPSLRATFASSPCVAPNPDDLRRLWATFGVRPTPIDEALREMLGQIHTVAIG